MKLRSQQWGGSLEVRVAVSLRKSRAEPAREKDNFSQPVQAIVNIPAHFSMTIQGTEYHSENKLLSAQATPKFLLILHCSIRC